MEFSAQQDVAAPAEAVFGMLSDWAEYDRIAQSYGAQIECLSQPPMDRVGSRLQARFTLGGKARVAEVAITDLAGDERVHLTLTSRELTGEIAFSLLPLSDSLTRLTARVDLRPVTLGTRVLMNSVKLARASADARFEAAVDRAARRIEARYRGDRSEPT